MSMLKMTDSGPYFEEFIVGNKFVGKTGRTITDVDNIWFTLLTNNNNQIHFNRDYTKKYFRGKPFYGRLVVNGFFILSTVAGLLVDYTSANGFMLGLEKLRFIRPVFAGDTIYGECTVLETRESKNMPNNGIVKIATTGYNQRHEKVIEFDRTFMVRKKRSINLQKKRKRGT